jgi:hypothetical protein
MKKPELVRVGPIHYNLKTLLLALKSKGKSVTAQSLKNYFGELCHCGGDDCT